MSALNEPRAHLCMIEVGNLAPATDRKMEAARHDMVAAKLNELVHQLDKATEFHRLVAAHLASILNSLGRQGVQ